MIGRLRGTLVSKTPPFLLVDVGGIGYELQAPMSTIYQLPDCGQPVELLTHFQVREDAQILYGFCEEQERKVFRGLIKISGVGPKVALTILSGMDVTTFIRCVEQRELAALVRLPGVGKKTAERVLIEMAGKLNITNSDEVTCFAKASEKSNGAAALRIVYEEAITALVALGFKAPEAIRAIGNRDEEANVTSEALIRRALQGLAKV